MFFTTEDLDLMVGHEAQKGCQPPHRVSTLSGALAILSRRPDLWNKN